MSPPPTARSASLITVLRDVAYPLKGVKQDGTQYTIYQAAGGQRTIRIGKGTKLKGLPMHDSDTVVLRTSRSCLESRCRKI